MVKMVNRQKLINFIRYLALTFIGCFFLFPFYVLFVRSFMTHQEVMTLPVKLMFDNINFENYTKAIDEDIIIYFKNTMRLVGINAFGVPFVASFCAFGFSRIEFYGRDKIFAILLSTIMLPAIVTQIPMYVIYAKIGWLDSILPLTIPALLGGGIVNIFLIRQFMRSIPKELDNAAKIDGANVFQNYYKIILPLCKPIIIFVGVQTYFAVWNDFMGPLFYLKTEDNFTLSLGLYQKFLGGFSAVNMPNIQMATGMMMLIPPLVLFYLFQKQLMEGVSFAGMKI